ncbi:hypothetical protein [Haematobacter genomosp. 1]|uniref:Uncharacterized protein n=1 Tax=Haematobacter genomosp. 1 TaxID=366618 RepID=A0A212AC48_9RHOB|nr:hypothetical protein [Haematobacter genomosp. 1]OWJ78431.1 hypothetical protein CDV49_08320 [Haematobacter genomosp. 1]
MPLYRYWSRDSGLGASKLTASTALASLMASTGYAVRTLSVTAGEYTTASGNATVPFTVTSSSGMVSISGNMPAGSTIAYTADPQRQAVIRVPAGRTIEITSKTPATASDAYGRIMHGAMMNPGVAPSPQTSIVNGFDQRAMTTAAPGAFSPKFNDDLIPDLPAVLGNRDNYVTVASRLTVPSNNQRYGLIEEYFTLTVTESDLPGVGDYAPPPFRSAAERAQDVTYDDDLDVDAIYAALPSIDLSATGPLTEDDLEDAVIAGEQFACPLRAMADTVSTNGGGYEAMTPWRSGMGSPDNPRCYGRFRSKQVAAMLPILYGNSASVALKKRAIRAAYSMGKQYDGIRTGPNGGHWTWHFAYAAFYRWCRGLPLDEFTMDDLRTGNILGQYYTLTPEIIASFNTPHNSATMPGNSMLRPITKITGNRVEFLSPESKVAYRGLALCSADGTRRTPVTDDSGYSGLNTPANKLVEITVGNASGFSVGDQVAFLPIRTLVPGDPEWHIRAASIPSAPTNGASRSVAINSPYRNQGVGGDFMLFAQALGIMQPGWEEMKSYVVRTTDGTYPVNGDPYPHMFEGAGFAESNDDDPVTTWGLRIFNTLWDDVLSLIPQPGA